MPRRQLAAHRGRRPGRHRRPPPNPSIRQPTPGPVTGDCFNPPGESSGGCTRRLGNDTRLLFTAVSPRTGPPGGAFGRQSGRFPCFLANRGRCSTIWYPSLASSLREPVSRLGLAQSRERFTPGPSHQGSRAARRPPRPGVPWCRWALTDERQVVLPNRRHHGRFVKPM